MISFKLKLTKAGSYKNLIKNHTLDAQLPAKANKNANCRAWAAFIKLEPTLDTMAHVAHLLAGGEGEQAAQFEALHGGVSQGFPKDAYKAGSVAAAVKATEKDATGDKLEEEFAAETIKKLGKVDEARELCGLSSLDWTGAVARLFQPELKNRTVEGVKAEIVERIATGVLKMGSIEVTETSTAADAASALAAIFSAPGCSRTSPRRPWARCWT